MRNTEEAAVLLALLDAAVDAIIIADRHGIIQRANRAAANLFGHPIDSFAGRNVAFLMPPGMALRHDGYMHHHIATGENRIIGIGRDVEGLRRDGTVFPLHLSVGKADINGELAFVAILHDQTRRRANEEAMARAQKMDAIGRMTGGIAHDFNNLLTVIIGNLELLELSEPAARLQSLITEALDAAELGADLTSRLLAFARKSPLRTEVIDVQQVTQDALAMVERTLSPRIRIRSTTVDDVWQINADPTLLQTAILNLALNAQDAMPEGGSLFIETANVQLDDSYAPQDIDAAPGPYVRLSVSDSGSGMTRDARERALEPFFTTKPPGKGTGLGLSMVYGFVKQSGGHLTIYSELGAGTTISLYFPAIAGRAPQPASVGAVSGTRDFDIGRNRVVLVVEDDPAVRRLSEARLAGLGFRCLTAADADAAWQIIEQQPDIALVFSDVMMPGSMSGLDLARRIAANYPQLRILLTSGFSAEVLRDGAPDRAFAILRKPYRQADLVNMIVAAFAPDDQGGTAPSVKA